MALKDNDKWDAVVTSDKNYDGRFFYGVITTRIFCRPSCTAKTPHRRNVVFFDTADDAIRAGFRPCKKCRPDLLSYEPERELVQKVKEIITQSLDEPQRLNSLTNQLGISSNHLMRLFKQYEGCTQSQYRMMLRIRKAKDLLYKTNMDILHVALSCGFESESHFYKCFKAFTGVSPAKFRRGTDYVTNV